MIDSFRTASLTQRVQQYIKLEIVNKNYQPGSLLPSQGEIATRLGVSRTAVREAVKGLEALGVVEVRHGDGLYVRPFNLDAVRDNLSYSLGFDVQTMAELLLVRKWQELGAVPSLISHLDEAALATLDGVLAHWENHTPSNRWAQDDRRFHWVLCRISGNRMFALFGDIYWQVLNSITDETLKLPSDPRQTIEQHRAIFDALRMRDIEATRAAISASYIDIESRTLKIIESRSREAPGHTPQIGEFPSDFDQPPSPWLKI